MSTLVKDRIKEFIENMDLSSRVLEISNDGTNTTITAQNVFNARAIPEPFQRSVLIDNTEYTVLSVDYVNNTVTVSGVVLEASVYTVPNPFFFCGTLVSTGNEIACLNPNDKCPMVYLNEPINGERPINSDLSFTGNIRLAFADYYSDDFTRDEHWTEIMKPLENLTDYIFEQWENEGCLSLTASVRVNNVPKWGTLVSVGNKGKKTSKKTFNERLDAIEWVAPLRFCKCD